MDAAILSGLIILVLLVVLLVLGVPIAIALGISSICAILPVLDTQAAVITGAQRIFSGISVFSLLAIPFFILAGNIMNKGSGGIVYGRLYSRHLVGAGVHDCCILYGKKARIPKQDSIQ